MKELQLTERLMMIRPANFGFNTDTASTNAFQSHEIPSGQLPVAQIARSEFDRLVELLRHEGVDVLVFEDTADPVKPDAVFPNNWITTHADGSLITYPMHAPNRRAERREDILQDLEARFEVTQRYSFDSFETQGLILEGTGSMILDRVNHIVYACLSPRTGIELLDKFCLLKQYTKVIFHARDPEGTPVYHTNVIMALGMDVAVVCLECIPDEGEKILLTETLARTSKTILEIRWDQVCRFAGNMLQVRNKEGQALWVMSDAANKSLTGTQRNLLSLHSKIISSPIPTIEQYGGGSVRCMLTEVFLRKRVLPRS